jgi:phosphoglucomutase
MHSLSAELMARTGRDPSSFYVELTRELGTPAYERVDAPASAQEKAVLLELLCCFIGLGARFDRRHIS